MELLKENKNALSLCEKELKSRGVIPTIHDIDKNLLSGICANVVKKINQIISITNKNNYAIGIVGGFVRDLLLENPSDDVDFIIFQGEINDLTEIIASEMNGKIGKMSNQTLTTQVRFSDGIVFEFNSTRKERYEYPSRTPIVEKASIFDDLNRRDFTINTFLKFGSKYVDIFNGTKDLKNSILQTTRKPSVVFHEDYLRMFRAIRFACKLDFEVADNVKNGIKKNTKNILEVPHERIINELKLSLESNSVKAFQLMLELNIFETLFPEIPDNSIDEEIFLVRSVWKKINLKLEYLWEHKQFNPSVLLSAILSELEIEKSLARNKQTADYLRFQKAILFLKKYTFSNKEIKEISQYMKNKDILLVFTELSPSLIEMRLFLRELGPLLENLISITLAENSTRRIQIFLDPIIDKLRQINENQELIHVIPKLDGNEIESIFGFKGIEIGEVKLILSMAIMNEAIPNTRDACIEYVRQKMIKRNQ